MLNTKVKKILEENGEVGEEDQVGWIVSKNNRQCKSIWLHDSRKAE